MSATTTTTVPAGTAPPSGSGTEVDNTKAAAIPVFFMLALVLAVFITRESLRVGFVAAKSNLRLGILYFGGVACAVASVFLFPTSGWAYGIVSALFAYVFALICAPGMLEKFAHTMFAATAAWFAVLLGIPSFWSSGIIFSVTNNCNLWFPNKQQDMCKPSWITWVTIIALCIVIANFFILLVLMSFAFDPAIAMKRRPANEGASGVEAQPLTQEATSLSRPPPPPPGPSSMH